jgi:hypothetical protein
MAKLLKQEASLRFNDRRARIKAWNNMPHASPSRHHTARSVTWWCSNSSSCKYLYNLYHRVALGNLMQYINHV